MVQTFVYPIQFKGLGAKLEDEAKAGVSGSDQMTPKGRGVI